MQGLAAFADAERETANRIAFNIAQARDGSDGKALSESGDYLSLFLELQNVHCRPHYLL